MSEEDVKPFTIFVEEDDIMLFHRDRASVEELYQLLLNDREFYELLASMDGFLLCVMYTGFHYDEHEEVEKIREYYMEVSPTFKEDIPKIMITLLSCLSRYGVRYVMGLSSEEMEKRALLALLERPLTFDEWSKKIFQEKEKREDGR